MSDLDYTVETEDLFVAAMDMMNHEAFPRRLGTYPRFNLREQSDKAKRRLQGALRRRNRSGLTLNGTIRSLQRLDCAITQNAVVIRMAAGG